MALSSKRNRGQGTSSNCCALSDNQKRKEPTTSKRLKMAQHSSEDQDRPWEDLPQPALVIIFKKLPLYDRFCGGPIVCRSWREASRNPQCWESMLPEDKSNSFEELFIKEELSWVVPFVRRPLSVKGIQMFVERSNEIATTMYLPTKEYVKSDLIDFIAQRCPKLKHLSVRNFYLPIWDSDLDCKLAGARLMNLLCSCKELELLDLDCYFRHLKPKTWEIIECFPKFRGLRVSGFEASSWLEEFDGVFYKFNLQLLNLAMKFRRLNDLEGILDHFKNLKFLRVRRDFRIDDGALAEKCKRIPEFFIDI